MKTRFINIWLIILIILLSLNTLSLSSVGKKAGSGSGVLTTKSVSLKIDATGRIEAVVSSSGRVWLGAPQSEKDSNTWMGNVRSTFIIKYTDKSFKQVHTANSSEFEPKLHLINSKTAKVAYSSRKLGISFDLVYKVLNNGFEISIPQSSVKETGNSRIVSIELLPFFGAAVPGDDGYMVIPDGSGAIARFKKDITYYRKNYSRLVYGEDSYDQEYLMHEQTSIPLFGMVVNGSGFAAFVTRGDTNVKISCSPAGYIVNYYRAAAEFIFRKEYLGIIRKGKEIPKVENRLIKTERAVRYVFLEGNEVGYSDMAVAYRRYLEAEKRLKPLTDNENRVMNIRVLCGIREKAKLFGSKYIVTASFSDVETLIDDLKKSGIKRFRISLVGWQSGGYEGVSPRRVSPEPKLGGEKGLKHLIAFAKSRGVELWLENDYFTAIKGNRGFSLRRDVVKGPNRMALSDKKNSRYILSPEFSLSKLLPVDIARLGSLGISGIELKHFGRYLLTDRNSRYGGERADFLKTVLNIASKLRQEFGKIWADGANLYLIGAVNGFTNVPLDSSGYSFEDESIPLLQIVMSGFAPYSSKPSNLRSDQEKEFLRMVEYGALPSYELTCRNSKYLKNTNYNSLFSSNAKVWLSSLSREYKKIVEYLGQTEGKKIVRHFTASPGVFVTVYENGGRTVVNYNDRAATYSGYSIPAGDFVYIQHGGKTE